MGIDKCRLEFLLSLKVVMLKRLEFHKEELYAILSQLMPLSEIRRLSPPEKTLTHNSQVFKKKKEKQNTPNEAALETQKKMSSAAGLQIWSQQKRTVIWSWENLLEGLLWKLRVATITHGNMYHQRSTRTGADPSREQLKEISSNLGPYGETFLERETREQEGNFYRDCLKHGLNLILSSASEN